MCQRHTTILGLSTDLAGAQGLLDALDQAARPVPLMWRLRIWHERPPNMVAMSAPAALSARYPVDCRFSPVAVPGWLTLAGKRLLGGSHPSERNGTLRSMPEALDGPSVCHDPVFILTGSRSGSTLLRFILDTHPDFACPPETMITGACVSLLRSWDILENAGSGQQRLVTEPAQLPAAALDTVRDTVDRLYGRYLARRGKPRWCDKSLDSQFNAELLAAMYPQARFVCLYRHCMDVIASGIEVCPWGVSRFGFDAYVAQNPGNNVAAIGSYWADCARVILAFEESQPERCFRVRYEDLVTAPEEVTAGLLHFLGATPAPGITAACFGVPHEGDGPGDEKIWFTSSVSADAIGRGVKVPAAALPYAVRGQINETLIKLGYRTIDDDWNDAPGAVDPRLPDTVQVDSGPGPNGGRPATGEGGSAAKTQPVLQALQERIQSRICSEPDTPAIRWPALGGRVITLVVTDTVKHSELSWTFPSAAADAHQENGSTETDGADANPASASADAADGGPVVTMIASPLVWQMLLDGTANMIVEIRSGRLRCVNRRDAHRVRSDEVHAIAWLLGLAQVPLARAAAS